MSRDNDLIKVIRTTCNQGRVKIQAFLSPRLMLFNKLPTPIFLGFPYGSAGKESACNVGDLGSIPGLGRSPGKGKGYPLQFSGLENFMGCIVHGVTESRTRLSDFHFHYGWVALFNFSCLGPMYTSISSLMTVRYDFIRAKESSDEEN